MQLKFPVSEIQTWYLRYFKESRPVDLVHEARIETVTALEVCARGWYTKAELVEVCRWKNPRSQARVGQNPESFIQSVTASALSTSDERLRIEVLTLLEGVSWPAASLLLHFGIPNLYPVLDSRSLWSLSIDNPPVSAQYFQYEFWWEYTQTCRNLAKEAGVSMRSLDRALWQYARVNQRPSYPHV